MPRARAQIDTAALAAAFAADGLHGTPIDRVVAAAGVAKPTLYARGGDKEELFALAVEAEVERLLERFEGGVGQIAAALDAYVAAEPGRAPGVRQRAASGASPRVERSLRRITIALTAAVGDEATRGGLARRRLVGAARRPAGHRASPGSSRRSPTPARRPASGPREIYANKGMPNLEAVL